MLMSRLFALSGCILSWSTFAEAADESVCLFGLKEPPKPAAPSSSYHWWRRGGNSAGNSHTAAVAPDLSKGPSWVWKNELDEQVRHSPLIDDDLNIYLQSSYHIRKFSADGQLLWTWQVEPHKGLLVISPALHEGKVYAMTTMFIEAFEYAVMHVLDMQTGEVLSEADLDESVTMHRDSPGLFIENGTVVIPVHNAPAAHKSDDPSPNALVGLDAKTLAHRWVYRANSILWNFMPSSVGDGSIVFASTCGRVMRVRLHDGSEVWRAGNLTAPANLWCSTSGGVLGSDGNFYAEYNHVDPSSSVSSARIASFRVHDGTKLWERALGSFDVEALQGDHNRRALVDFGGWQYPGVGLLGKNKKLAVVAAVGGITTIPPVMDWAASWSPITRDWLWNLYLGSASFRKSSLGGSAPDVPNAVVAMDAQSGSVLWRYEFPVWDHFGAIDDEARVLERAMAAANSDNPAQRETICLPGAQGIPVIGGDGTVYASDSHTGALYAIKDANDDGLITEDEVSKFETQKEFLNSPSVAPGMLAAAPCWGDMYVFRA